MAEAASERTGTGALAASPGSAVAVDAGHAAFRPIRSLPTPLSSERGFSGRAYDANITSKIIF